VRFWDSSALVALCIRQAATDAVVETAAQDPSVVAWWTTPVECTSAIARLERDGRIDQAAAREAFARLDRLAASWSYVDPVDEIRDTARRLLRTHRLRAADALQLAAAYMAAERRPVMLTIVTLDDRLATAATKEGFDVVVPA